MNTYEFDDNFLTIIKEKVEELKNTSLAEKEKKDIINGVNELVDKANSWIEIERTRLEDEKEELEEEQEELESLAKVLLKEIEELKNITAIYKCNNTIDMFEGE
jgi:hypothetical protein